MALIKCPECGKEISDLASNCPNCGFPIGFDGGKRTEDNVQYQQNTAPQPNNTQQPNNSYQQNSSYQQTNSYQQNNTYQPNMAAQPIRAYIHEPAKNSGLSIAALILSILGITSIIGAILAIVDLCRKDGKKKLFSVISLCICSFWLFVTIIGGSNTDDSQKETSSIINQETQSESVVENSETPKKEENKYDVDEGTKTEKQIDIEKEEPKISREDFISSCEEIPYKTLARNPEENIGKHIKLTVKVSQIVQGGLFDNGEYYRVYTNDEYGMWLGDEYFMYDERDDKGTKILQDDILTVYAECAGTTQVKRALTNTKEDVVSIKAIYIDLIEEEDYGSHANSESNDQEDDGLSTGQRNALNQAKSYLEWSAFSYNGLISQLEYEQYSHEDAVFAADNCGADWNEQAVEKAKSYLEFSSFSRDGLIEQLEYEGFTHEQAVYGAEANGY